MSEQRKKIALLCALCGQSVRPGEYCLLIHRRSGAELGRACGRYTGHLGVRGNRRFAGPDDPMNSYAEILRSMQTEDSCGFYEDGDYVAPSVKDLKFRVNGIQSDMEELMEIMYRGVTRSFSGLVACHSVCSATRTPEEILALYPSYWFIPRSNLEPPRLRFLAKPPNIREEVDVL